MRFVRPAMAAGAILALLAARATGAPPRVCVCIPPQRWAVRQLAGDAAEVRVLVSPGQNPHTFEPTARQVAGLADADLYLSIGLPFEQVVLERAKSVHPGLRVVPVDAGILKRHGQTHEDPGPADTHGVCRHDGADPHVWLSPANMARIATNTCRALASVDVANAPRYEAALVSLTARLEALQRELAAELEPVRGGQMLVHHPSWGYFADAFGLTLSAIEDEGREPSARRLAALVEAARKAGVRTLFTDPQFDPRPAQTLARQLGARVQPLDPLAETWDENLRQVSRRVCEALGRTPGEGRAAP